MTPWVLLYLVASLAALGLAWLKGGHPERMGAVIWLVGWIASMPLNDIRFGDARLGVAAVDAATFAAFLWLALRHARWWPLGVCASFLLMVAVHFSAVLSPEMTAIGESSAQLGLGLLAVLFLAAGAFERWLAGETPISASAIWSRSRRAA